MLILACVIASDALGWYHVAMCILAFTGGLLTLYTMDVSRQVKHQPDYLAPCDIGERVSCTATLKAPSSALVLGVSNT